MTCSYTYKGQTYEVSEFDDLLRAMPPAEAAAFMPGVTSVPAAPFVGKTDAWVALALKRVIKLAVDGGYDRVAFVTGEQSAERYDLSKRIDRIHYEKADDGKYELIAYKVGSRDDSTGSEALHEDEITIERVEELVGKEIAKKIADESGDSIGGPYRGRRELKNVDLKVGGEGMKAFYDRIVPSVLKDVLRKVGGGSLQTVEFARRKPVGPREDDGAGGVVQRTVPAGWDVVDTSTQAGEARTQPGFDITPAMREKAAGGLPLFKRDPPHVETQTVDGMPTFRGQGIELAFPLPTERFEVIPGPGEQVLNYPILKGNALESLGFVELLVKDGKPISLLDIEVNKAGRALGVGRKVIETLLAANPDSDLNISNIVESARGFWAKMGIPEQNRGAGEAYDASLSWEIYAQAQASDRSGTGRAALPKAQGNERPGGSADAGAKSGAQGALGQAPLLSRGVKPTGDPVLDAAKRKAGVRGPQSLADKVQDAYGRALDLVRSRGELAHAARQGTLDQFHGINRAVTRELGGLPTDQDPYITARLANGGTSSVMRALMLHGQAKWAANGQHLEKIDGTKGLLDILKPLGDDLNDWFGWMVGNRAARLMKEGRENNLSADEIKALQALATPEKRKAFFTAAAQYGAFKRSVLDVAQEAGLIEGDARKAWDHADYIPFYREIDEQAVFGATGKKGLAGQSSGIRTLKGGEAELNDPMENLLMNFSRLIDASLKNNAISKTIETLETAKSDLVKKVGYDMKSAIIPRGQVRKMLIEAGTPESVIATMPDAAFDGMAKMWGIQAPTDPKVVRVMRGGKPVFYRVEDPLLLSALTSFVPFDFPGLAVMRGAKRLLTAMVTSTPEFMARNFIRDSMASQAITQSPFNPVESIKGIARSYKEQGGYEAMLFAGASFQSGNVNAGNPESTAVHMRRALRERGMDASSINSFMGSIVDYTAAGWEKYRQVGEAIENANREAVYEGAKRAGKSATAAAFEAKDLMDFSLRGSWAGYQLLADVLPFFNARVQGLYRLGRVDPKRLAMVGGIMLAASLALALANAGEDWYEELEDWDKDTYWHFKVKGHHFRVPKPFELGVLFATIPERLSRSIMGLDTGKKTLTRLWSNVRDQLAFDPVPQIARPALDAWANKDSFRDRPIEGQGDEGKPVHARYDVRTSDTMRVLANAAEPVSDSMGLSPKKLEFLVNGYFGTVGMYALSVADAAVRKIEGKPVRPELRADDLPIVRAFYRMDPARSTIFASDIYKMHREVEEVVKEFNALRNSVNPADKAKAQALAEKNKTKIDFKALKPAGEEDAADKADRLQLAGDRKRDTKDMAEIYADEKLTKQERAAEVAKILAEKERPDVRGLLTFATKQMGAINKQMTDIYNDPSMTAKQKRVAIDDLQAKKNLIAKDFATDKAVKAAF